MARLIAPVKKEIPKSPTLSELIAPVEPGKVAIGPNINWGKIPGTLSRLLELADPSGMMTGPAGLVWKAPAMGAKWSPAAFDAYQRAGNMIELAYPRIKAATEFTEAWPLSQLIDKPTAMGEFISSSSRINPYGKILAYGPRNPWHVLPHEMLHRLYDTDLSAKALASNLYLNSPPGTEDLLRLVAHPSTKATETLAYTLENLIRDRFGQPKSYIFRDVMPQSKEQLILDWLRDAKSLSLAERQSLFNMFPR